MNSNQNTEKVADFYNNISKKYTASVKRCVPLYTEMLESLFHYLPDNFKPTTILDLGSGTGNLTEMICEKFPNAKITAIDLSLDCINECKKRTTSPNIEYVNCDFRELDLPENYFDLIVSSISIHHINAIEKQKLFSKLIRYLVPHGIFSFCDQCKGETDFIYQQHISAWKEYAFAQGSSDEEWNMWMKHQAEHDYHDTVSNYLLWLNNAGYSTVDCTKKHLLWTSFFAEK